MKKLVYIALAASLMMGAASCNKKGGGVSPLEDSISTAFGEGWGIMLAQQFQEGGEKIDKEAFVIGFEKALMSDTTAKGRGYQYGYGAAMQLLQNIQGMESQGIHVDRATLLKAFRKVFGDKAPMNDTKMMQLQQRLQSLMMKAQQEAQKTKIAANKKFMQEQKAKDKDLVETKSGILYKIEKKGNGKNYKKGDCVLTKYVGKHTDGSVFDKSDKAVPFVIDDTQLIKGFVEIMQLMSPGTKAHVIIPSELAYGERGNQGIAPNEVLVFDIETGELTAKPQMPEMR